MMMPLACDSVQRLPWLQADDAKLIRLWAAMKRGDLRVRDIAGRMGRTIGAVYDRARVLGLDPCRPLYAVRVILTVIEGNQMHRVVRVRLRPALAADLRRGETRRRITETNIRTCLGCQNPFRSEWIGNRMCIPCRENASEML